MKLFLSGPMTGLPDYNRAAFHKAAAHLRVLGHHVVNPAENPPPVDDTWQGWMRLSLRQVTDVDAMVMLPGWERSDGALLEHYNAMKLGMVAYPMEMADRIPL